MGNKWRQSALMCILICLMTLCGCAARNTTALVPLDSRPCNTQECLLLAEAAQTHMLLPEAGLDDFTTPGDPEALWQWLDQEATAADTLILFSNSLLNGGLIASRDLDSYTHYEHFHLRLEEWLRAHSDVAVTLVTVLPRSMPSQYDPLTAPYSQPLQDWGAALDRALREDLPVPPPPASVPPEASRRYMALFEVNLALCTELLQLEESGLLEAYYIAYDDNSPYCASRAMVHLLAPEMSRPALNGADEITAMLLARGDQQLPLQIHYTDPAAAEDIPPFEGQSLADTVAEKCAFLNFTPAPTAPRHLVVHNSPGNARALASLLESLPPDEPVSLADVAQTNRGDAAIWPLLSQPPNHLMAYSGWNTTANSLGTSLSALRLAEDHPKSEPALQRYLTLRLAIDQGYLAHLGPDLRAKWQAKGLITPEGVFIDPHSRQECTDALNKAFQAWATDSILSSTPPLYFPWQRTFEVGQALA